MSINLYKVTVGEQRWYYTSGEFDVEYFVHTYLAKPLKRTDLSFDIKQTEVTLTMPADLEPFSQLKYVTPLLPFTVEIMGYPSLVTVFKGNVVGASFDVTTNVAKVKLGSVKSLENSTAPSRTFGTTCSHELFSGKCGLLSDDYKTTILKENIVVDGHTLTASDIGLNGDHYYHGGYIVASTGESQYIVSQVGDVITLLGGIVTIDDVTSIDFFPGCNKGHMTCADKFSNQINFGGFPFIPYINIFTEPF